MFCDSTFRADFVIMRVGRLFGMNVNFMVGRVVLVVGAVVSQGSWTRSCFVVFHRFLKIFKAIYYIIFRWKRGDGETVVS